jgi:RimJ/RimL family protein N-acetyltransferase
MIETERLFLRQWRPSDLEPFSQLTADPQVMEFFPSTLTRIESDHLAHRISSAIAKRGWGLFAAERKQDRCFIGFIGLSIPDFTASFTPCVEIGWRLSRHAWGRGFATEGAAATLRYAFETLHLPEVLSFAVTANTRSRRVMEKIGMHHDPSDDFEWPGLPPGHPRRRHVLYRISHADWLSKATPTPDQT